MPNSCSRHLSSSGVQGLTSQTNGLDAFRAVVSMHIIKVASDSRSLLTQFAPLEQLWHTFLRHAAQACENDPIFLQYRAA